MTVREMAAQYAAKLQAEGWDKNTAEKYVIRRFGWGILHV